ncbi:MAG TPA: hypothetical protein PK992_12940 [Planctomycetaceae bacterium]|nr:hypothetical protein [Planctomycetaceae bacterium]
MKCSSCQAEFQAGSPFCGKCGAELGSNPYQSPTARPARPVSDPNEGDATGGIIPYKNPKALIAYYLGIFSGFPIVGFFLAVPALVLGIMGLRDRNRNPAIKGSIHAGIGIGCDALFTLLWGGVIIALIIGAVTRQH